MGKSFDRVASVLGNLTLKIRGGDIPADAEAQGRKAYQNLYNQAQRSAEDNKTGALDRDDRKKYRKRAKSIYASFNAALKEAREKAVARAKSYSPPLVSTPFPVTSPSRASKAAPKPFPGAALAFVAVVLILRLLRGK